MGYMTHKEIMQKAKSKYDLLMNSGKWGSKSPNQEKTLALEAQLKEQELKLFSQQNQRKQGANANEHARNNYKTRKDNTNKCLQKKDKEWKKMLPKDN